MLGAWHQTCLFTWAVLHVTDTACPSQHPRNAPPNRNQVATGPERPKTTCVQLWRAKYYDYSNLSQLPSTRNHWLLRLLHTLSQVVSWNISDSGCASSHLDTSPRWTWHSVEQPGDSTIRQFMLVYLDGQLAGQFCQQLCIGTCRDLKNEDLKSFDIEVSLNMLEEIDRFCLASLVFIVSSSGRPTLRLVAAHQHQRLCPFPKIRHIRRTNSKWMKMTQSIDSMDYDGSFQYLLTTWQREDPNHVSPQWPKLVGTSAKFGFSQNFLHQNLSQKIVQQHSARCLRLLDDGWRDPHRTEPWSKDTSNH